MYPRLSDLFKDFLGFEFPIPIYSFGAMVALGFLTAAWLSQKEFDRLHQAGRLPAVPMPLPEEKGKKRKGKRRRVTTKLVSPSVLMGTITMIAVVGGFLGAKLFHILENLGSFARNPLEMIFSTGGFTFYGGLIVAAVSISWYVKKKGLPVSTTADASLSERLKLTATLAPSRASALEISPPTSRPPPVTSATLPFRLSSMSALPSVLP